MNRRPRPRRISLNGFTVSVMLCALLYVAAVWVHVVTRFQPIVAQITDDGSNEGTRFERIRQRASQHALVRAALATHLRNPSARGLDSLEALRRDLQGAVIANPSGAQLLLPPSSPQALVEAVDAAIHAESRLRTALIQTIAALETADLATARRAIARADSLDGSLAAALAVATDLSVAEVWARQRKLSDLAAEESRLAILWLLLGGVLFAVVMEASRRRLRQPLAEIDRGLDRLSHGDLEVHLSGEGDDDLGRLARHVNRTADSLRTLTAETETRITLRSLERARALMDAALDAVVVVDAEGMIREWNPQASAMFGWEREQMLGVSVASVLFPELGGDHAAAERLKAVLGGDDARLRQRTRATARRGDGDFVPIELGIARIGDDVGEEFALFIRDISGEEAAQQALLDSEARYRASFDQSVDGKFELDRDGVIVSANAAALEIVGLPRERVIGRRVYEMLPAEVKDEERRDLESLRNGSVSQIRREREVRRADGQMRWLSWIGTVVRDAHGTFSHVLVTLQDVTSRIELERELRQAHKMDAVGQLAGGVAHDFNNILAGIIGYADLLEHEAGGNDAIRHEARAIVATAQRGADLAQKLLALARELPTTLSDFDARDVVHEVHAIIRRAFDRNVEIRVDVDERPVLVRADRTQLSNAVLNLALNARDAMPNGGRLTLRARPAVLHADDCTRFGTDIKPGQFAALTVTDTGVGMSRELLARVFEPFFTTKEHGKGTGLGLAMVYGTMRAHEGVVDVDSVPGVGSTFRLLLPLLDRAADVTPSEPARALVQGKGEVLLADDETTVREVATRMLRRLGYTVEAVADGVQAVARFRAEPDRFAFVLLDGDMPRMHGREAARQIRETRPEARIFLATGYLTHAGGADDSPNLFTGVLSKPYTLQELSRLLAPFVAERAKDAQPVS